jgi:hypothetical protein
MSSRRAVARYGVGDSSGAPHERLEQLRLLHPGWQDVLEVVIVSYAIYRLLLLLRRTRAVAVSAGSSLAAPGMACALHLSMIIYLLTLVFSYGAMLRSWYSGRSSAALLATLAGRRCRAFHLGESESAISVGGGTVEPRASARSSRSNATCRSRSMSIGCGNAGESRRFIGDHFPPYSPLHDGAV